MTLEFKMPKLGESVTEGTIGRWLKQPGDTLEQYEPMLEVTTDKVDTEVSSPVSGTLVEILVPEGETVEVGTTIARLADVNEHAGSTGNGSATAAEAAVPAAAPTQSGTAATAKAAPISPAVARLAAEHNVDLRKIAGTGREGRVTKKDVEAFVAARGTAPSEVQTPTPTTPPARIDDSADQQAITSDAALQQTLEAGPRDEDEEHALAGPPAAVPSPAQSQPVTSPAVQVQPSVLPSASPASSLQSPTPALGPGDELVPLTGMRRAIAEHMVRSKQTAPHVTTVFEVDLSRVVAHRARHKADFERQEVKLTFTPYFVQACVRALHDVPIVNASFGSDGIVMHNHIHIGMAVAIPDGLIVPVIKDADEKSLLGLSRTVNDLAERARTRRLQPDDTQGGTFTITNHGISGSLFAMPIINQPQSAILGIGAIQKRVVVVTENGFDAMAIRPMCYLSLTFDHRLIDGATADAFVSTVKQTLETYGE
jgi:2-oxoglutarate dehydrogenase E2 component (dihydrolipoamide succinyltransferase)